MKQIFNQMATNFFPNIIKQGFFFLIGDIIAIAIASFFTFSILDSFAVIDITFPVASSIYFAIFTAIGLASFRMYQVNWRFTSLRELLFICLGLSIGLLFSQLITIFDGTFSSHRFSYTVLLFLLSILTLGGFRISNRMLNEIFKAPKLRHRAVIFGAGNAADQLLRDANRHHQWSLNIVAIFDDNDRLHGINLHGIKILGDRKKMYSYLRYAQVDELIIAIPSLPKKELQKIIQEVQSIISDLKVKVLPSYHLLTDDPVSFKNIREISIDDILGREPIRGDMKSLENSMTGQTILITGAGGSIGGEIVRQLIHLKPKKIIALDIDETELFHLMNDYAHLGDLLEPCVANVTDKAKMIQVFEKETPNIVFHAAAYKHVPMMEMFPEEAIKVNIGGTRILSKLSGEYGVRKFVLISTDKAVNPTNVMGATKRVAEEVCLSYNELCHTKFICVRFGNVLGSRGSVVPIFLEQIRNGGPVTITHKNIERYFMTIPEAVILVIQAGVIGNGGEVFVLDMGEPVKIDDMARQLIRLHGLEPVKDIAIEYTGLRPGEKMFEEVFKSDESIEPTSHKLIHKAICKKDHSKERIDELTELLMYKVQNGSPNQARMILKELVPNYDFKLEADYLIREVLE